MKTSSIQNIVKRDGKVVPYDRARIRTAIQKAMAAVQKPNMDAAERMAKKVERALVTTYGDTGTPTVEDIQDVVENVLMENRQTEIARRYIIYRHRRAMARAARAYQFEVSDNVPYRKLYEVLRWNMEHDCGSVSELNDIIRQNELPDLIRAADARYDEEVRLAARDIHDRIADARIVIIAGPSSSGKTTTTIKLGEHLRDGGNTLKSINIDNYFFDLEKHPKDEFGDYDYETPQALDMELINEHLVDLLAGKKVKTPHYDFKTGRRKLNVHEICLEEDDLLLIDSLHGLHEDMTRSVPEKNKFKLYVETLGQFKGSDGDFMRWADNRLLRRMSRDKDHRNLKPIETLTHWHYVRRSELRNIIPFIGTVDCIVNTALPYELPIFRQRLFRYVSAARNRYSNDPKRLDAHIRANRLYDLLKPIKAAKDDSCVPGDSLLREFIGGSVYQY